jgi:hypothetical protein
MTTPEEIQGHEFDYVTAWRVVVELEEATGDLWRVHATTRAGLYTVERVEFQTAGGDSNDTPLVIPGSI